MNKKVKREEIMDKKIIKRNLKITTNYLDMNLLPEEFHLGVSLMVENLTKKIAKVTLIRTKDYAEYVKEKSELLKLTLKLEEALDYWTKKKKLFGDE